MTGPESTPGPSLPGFPAPAGFPAPPLPAFPGGTAVSALKVYDWEAADGLCGGSPHLHTVSSEAYLVTGGSGRVQTLSMTGAAEHDLSPGSLLWFSPGTVHRLVNTDSLALNVIMSNAGLPEAGDAVLTFPPHVLADPELYAANATLPGREEGEDVVAAAARRRRDLALEGYAELREAMAVEGPSSLARFHQAAAALVRPKVAKWRGIWEDKVRADVEATARALDALEHGSAETLSGAAVARAHPRPGPAGYGMCGRLSTWQPPLPA
ncbi:cupin domain-containing protein [Pseudarthrobacter sp. J64]|uniref:cupin domain-containing protein n=1 Tax=Pseudarthrobacter sp. J64 TaxID=3116485 RepID=UPI002E81D6BE|nr:cupin domain-containing protein [Pseudarthrobacter sp. J64]MEE2568963.1 cupin domain-containing protein [Pseudarthrobacter sp. J64]